MSTPMSQQAYRTLETELEAAVRAYTEAHTRMEDIQGGGDDAEGLSGVEAVFEADAARARVERLQRAILDARIVEGGSSEIGIGSTVTIDAGEGPETYRYEMNAGAGCIGRGSPLGEAIWGKRAGDTCQVPAPGGTYTVTVLEVG